jgi:hypothetical protein
MDEWDVLAGAFRNPRGSLWSAANSSTEPVSRVNHCSQVREGALAISCIPGTSMVSLSSRMPMVHLEDADFSPLCSRPDLRAKIDPHIPRGPGASVSCAM